MTVTSAPPRTSVAARRHGTALRVLSIDSMFMEALRAGVFEARVHSVFDRVINLQRTTGELFTLASRTMDDAPMTAIVDSEGFGTSGVSVGAPVSAIDGAMQVGDSLVLHMAAASIWKTTLPSYGMAPGRMSDQLRLARSYLARHGVRGGMTAPAHADGAFAQEVAAALEQRATSLFDAMARGRHADACRHAVSMLGLGPGLTPSGDDFLVGLFAILNVAGSPCHGWLDGGAAVLAHAGEATNAISLAALNAASGGRVRKSIAALIESLLHGNPETLVQPLRRVLAIGATSGADLVAGILAGLELNLQVQATRSLASSQHCSTTAYRGSHAAATAIPLSTGA